MTKYRKKQETITIRSEHSLPEDYKNITAPEYVLSKCKHRRGPWIRDCTTHEYHNFENLENESRSIASALYKQGFRKGDIAIYMAYNVTHLHVFLMGVWRANGIARALYPEEDKEKLFQTVKESRTGWIFCDEHVVSMAQAVKEQVYWDIELIVPTTSELNGVLPLEQLMNDDGTELPVPDVESRDTALILCTSGTTGGSKGAVHTHESLVATIISFSLMDWMDTKTNLLLSKGTHISGTTLPLSCLAFGGTSLVMSKVTKENFFTAIQENKPGVVFAFPSFLVLLANDADARSYDFTSLEYAFTGGAHCTPPMKRSILEALPNMKSICNVWGLTEGAPFTAEIHYPAKYGEAFPDYTVGKILPGVALQTRHIDTGATLGPKEQGEICVRAPTLFWKYMNNPKATKDAFIDGFFRTGDIGYYDENQCVYIVDRLKDIFKYMGNHISPTEIEDVINRHPKVAQVCVIPVTDENGGGEVPRAFITAKAGTECTKKEILDFAHEQLPEYKQLRGGLYFVPDLPKGKTGKVSRLLVAKMAIPTAD